MFVVAQCCAVTTYIPRMLVEAMTLDGRVDAEAQRIAQGLRLRDVALIHQLVEHY
jgi:hypothetical protein